MLEKFFSLFRKNKSTVKIDKTKDSMSSITFEFDEDLNVTTHTRINSKIIIPLINSGYLQSVDSEDQALINLVFILMANEVTEQIINKTNEAKM